MNNNNFYVTSSINGWIEGNIKTLWFDYFLNYIDISKLIETRDNELLVLPASKKERVNKGMKYNSYFFQLEGEKITIDIASFMLSIKPMRNCFY